MSQQPSSTNPEDLWDQILSRQAESVRSAFASLSPQEQSAVLAHLHRMSEEPGWHLEQQKSAQAALQILLKSLPPDL